MMTSMQSQEGTVSNQDTIRKDLEMVIKEVPIVYTTKLDDMWIFQRDIKNISKGDLVDIILCESLPVFNSLVNVKPEEKDITNYIDFKLKLCELFYKKSKKAPLKFKNTKLKRRKQSSSNRKRKSNANKHDSESQFDPSIESESSEDINVIIIDCYGVQTMSTLRALKYALKDVELTIYDRTSKENDVYVLDTDGSISEHHRVIENDAKSNKNNYNKEKVVVDFCCWVQRNKGVNSMYPSYVSLPTLKFMLKSHNCLPNRCLCCCREDNIDEIRTTNEASVISESKYVIPQDTVNYFLHKNWLADLKKDAKSSSNLIDRALYCNGMPTIKTNIKINLNKTFDNWERYNKKVRFMKHEEAHKVIYEFSAKGGNLLTQNRMLSANYYAMVPKPYYLERIAQSKRYSGCCWYDYNRIEKNLVREELNNIAKYYRRPHLCPIDYCACCCKNKCNETNLKTTAPQTKCSSKKKNTDIKARGTALSASSTNYGKIGSDMTVTLLTKRSKIIWEKFEDLRVIVTDEGKVSARVPQVSLLSTDEVKALSKILASAEKEVQRQSLQPGTCINIRMTDQNDDCLQIALELVNDSNGIENVMNNIQEQEPILIKEESQHQASEPNIDLTDIMQKQVVLPPVVFECVIEDNNAIQHVIHNIQEPENDLLVAEHHTADPTILNFKLDEAERTSKVIDGLSIDSNNIKFVIQQPSTDPVLIPFQNIAPNENQDCQIGSPRIETTYSMQSISNNNINTGNYSECFWHLPTCESTQFTIVASNDNQDVENMKSAPKRKSDVQRNVPSKIRVVSPSELGGYYGTNDEKTNEPTPVHRHYCKQNTSAIDKTNFTLVKVSTEPNNSRQIQNEKFGETPKYVKILPKPPNLSKAKNGSELSASSAKSLNMPKAEGFVPTASSPSNKMKREIIKIIINPNDYLQTDPLLSTGNSNDSIKVTENSNSIGLEELTTMHIIDMPIPRASALNSIDDEVIASESGTISSHDVALQLSYEVTSSELETVSSYDVAPQYEVTASELEAGSSYDEAPQYEVTASELETVSSYDVAPQYEVTVSELGTVSSYDVAPQYEVTASELEAGSSYDVAPQLSYEVTASELKTVSSYDVAPQLSYEVTASELKTVSSYDVAPQLSYEVTASELKTVSSYDVAPQLSYEVTASELKTVSSYDVAPQFEVNASELETVSSNDVAAQLSSLNRIDDEVTATELGTVNSYDVAPQLSSLNRIDDEVTPAELGTVSSYNVAPQLSSLNSIDDEVTATELGTVSSYDVAPKLSSLNIIDDEVTASELRPVNSCDVPPQLSTVNNDMSNKVTAPTFTTVNSYDEARLSRINSNENVDIENSNIANKKSLMTMNEPTIVNPKRPIILKRRDRYIVTYKTNIKY